VPRSDTGENKLLKLTFGETTNQIRDLNSNARITFIQKKAEPINFTKAIDKKQLTLSSHLATRENHLILKDAKKGDIGKVAIRKNMLNTSPSKKKLAYRREIYHNKRLLWVTKQIILPIKTPITIITNSYDVIHS
jgi:heme/copper-type cytochrome/quinol oxidase subunit 2